MGFFPRFDFSVLFAAALAVFTTLSTQAACCGGQVEPGGNTTDTVEQSRNFGLSPSGSAGAPSFHGIYWPCRSEDTGAVLVCVHGVALCAQSYEDLADVLTKRGTAVYSMDVRGFASKRCASERLTKLDLPGTVLDLKTLVAELRRKHPKTPIFLLGESMGANVILCYARSVSDPVDGIICSAPAGRLYKQEGMALGALVTFPLKLQKPAHLFTSSIIRQSTASPVLRQHLQEKPLEHRLQFSLAEAFQFLKFAKSSLVGASYIRDTHVLMIQGMQDRLAIPGETARLFRHISCNKKFVLVAGAEHLIFEEKKIDSTVAAVVTNFLTETANHAQPERSTQSALMVGTPRHWKKARKIFRKAGIMDDSWHSSGSVYLQDNRLSEAGNFGGDIKPSLDLPREF